MVCSNCGKKIDEKSKVCEYCGEKIKKKKGLNLLNLKKKDKKQESKIEKITFFGNKWEVEKLLGEGSFGKVYKVKKEEFGLVTYAAIKTIKIPQHKSEIQELKNEGMDNSEIREYFQNFVKKWLDEIKLMQSLKSSVHVVNIEDYEVIENPKEIEWNINIRMELLESLEDYLNKKDITNKDILKIGIDISKALEHCRKFNIIHRDIKPDNIFISDLGDYKLGDFSIARNLEKTTSGLSKKGTYTYMAPEVYKGEKYNSTIDIYSLGIVLYRYFNNNRIPFLPNYPEKITYEDREESIIKRMSGEEVLPPANATEEESKVILKAIEYDSKKRYQTATEFRKNLEKVYNKAENVIIFEKTLPTNIEESTGHLKGKDPFYFEKLEKEAQQLNKTISIFDEKPQTKEKDKKETKLEKTVSIINEEPKIQKKKELDKTISIFDNKTEGTENSLNKTVSIFNDTNEEKDSNKTVSIINEEAKKEEKIISEKKVKIEKLSKSKNEKQKLKKKTLILIGILLLLLLIILGIFFYLKMNFVKVPNVVGMTSTEALELLEEKDLIENIIEKEVSDDQVGKVIEQEDTDDYVKKDSVINITIGVSNNKTEMINVVGLSKEEAETKLKEKGLTMKVIEENNNEVASGYVISQVILEGEQIPKGSVVEVLVSKGNNKEEPKEEIKEDKKNKEWSKWVEKLPSNVTSKNYTIETKTQYRKRDKSTTSSTSSTMSGWTKYDEETTYGDWSSNKTTYSKVTSSDTTKIVSSKKEWVYYHYVNYYDGTYNIDSIKYGNNIRRCSFVSDHELEVLGYNMDKGGQVMYKTGWKCGDDGFTGWFLEQVRTKVTYQTRTKTTTYYYYKWSNWSEWSNSKITENDSREVEIKTLYRYKEK